MTMHLSCRCLFWGIKLQLLSIVLKFIWDREYPRMRQRSDELCREDRLSVVEEAADMEMRLHRGAVWAERQGKPTRLS